MASGDPFHELAGRAMPALRAALGADVAVAAVEPLKAWERNRVARLRLAGASLPSVIVKAIVADDALGFTDWASLAYIAGAASAAGVAPPFPGGDVAERLFLMMDLGGARTLDDVLREPSRPAALATLDALARVTARLHAATLGDDARWFALRASLPGARPGREVEADLWRDRAAPALGAWLAACGTRPPAGLADALERVADAYARPGPWLAFAHGDPAPTNNHVAPDGAVRLLDFEYGAPRHALYDVTAWAVLCPLPRDALAVVRAAYRSALGGALPFDAPAWSGASFDDAWGTMAAWRAVAMLGWIGPDALAADRPWVEEWTRREAALAAAERLRDEAGASPALAPLVDAVRTIARAIRERFPEYEGRETIPRWNAFSGTDTEGAKEPRSSIG